MLPTLLLSGALILSVAIQGSLAWTPANEPIHKQVVQANDDAKTVVDSCNTWLGPGPSHIPASGDTETAILKLDATLDLATVLLAKADVTLSASDLLDVIALINTLKVDVSIIVGLVTARLLDIKLGAKALLLQGLLVKLQASIKGFKDACAKKASTDSANILIKLALDLDLELSTCIGLLGIL
ncbi:hypothetical protein CBOM_00234 [Ceraceosorus bombacis]|uniref:Cell wall galactomannoprotein n=1 Tax=Ceraceosorus bombacis TaxID=401625 RepID=A0A0P1BAU4_9BASI|nr:hypothetical protein CBOM_00234 [Ceraceosorus bombacis]